VHEVRCQQFDPMAGEFEQQLPEGDDGDVSGIAAGRTALEVLIEAEAKPFR